MNGPWTSGEQLIALLLAWALLILVCAQLWWRA